MDPEHCDEADREFIQYSHRRVAWLALGRYDKALLDADHTLSLMDFVARHGSDFDYVASHERFRGVVILHRTQALAAIAIDRRKSEEAIDVVHDGIDQLYSHQKSWREILRKMIEEDPESVDDDEDFGLVNLLYIEQLRRLGAEIRKNFGIEKTLREQLDEAVSQEDYECAARLRDMIRGRGESGRKAR